MGLLLTTTAGLVVWIVLWALGTKGFDAFMITLALILVGATMRIPASVPARQQPRLDSRPSARHSDPEGASYWNAGLQARSQTLKTPRPVRPARCAWPRLDAAPPPVRRPTPTPRS